MAAYCRKASIPPGVNIPRFNFMAFGAPSVLSKLIIQLFTIFLHKCQLYPNKTGPGGIMGNLLRLEQRQAVSVTQCHQHFGKKRVGISP